MNPHSKQIIAHAFAHVRFEKADKALSPPPEALTRWLLSLCQSPRSQHLEAPKAQRLISAVTLLSTFVGEGCPVVSLTVDMARALVETDPPDASLDPGTWKLRTNTLLIDIGATTSILIRPNFRPEQIGADILDGLDDDARAEALQGSVVVQGDPIALTAPEFSRLTDNIRYILETRPEGLTVMERHPSAKAARKRSQDSKALPRVEYVISSTQPLQPKASASSGASTDGDNRRWTVRTLRRGHYTHQPYGEGRQFRKVIWRAPTWCGPEGAPISVHATRIE